MGGVVHDGVRRACGGPVVTCAEVSVTLTTSNFFFVFALMPWDAGASARW